MASAAIPAVAPEPGRYHLFAAWTCPWPQRTLLVGSLEDGNKRVAVLAVAVFLAINGYDFDPDEVDEVRTVLALAAGEVDEEGLAAWIRSSTSVRTPTARESRGFDSGQNGRPYWMIIELSGFETGPRWVRSSSGWRP